MTERPAAAAPPARDDGRSGLGALDADRFDAAAAVGGWRGILESAVPTLVFICVLAARPQALVPALLASLAVSALALLARLRGRQPLTQVLGGAALAAISALWAWRTGSATNFYATGLVINALWLAATGGSLLLRRPLVGVLLGAWHAASGGEQIGTSSSAGSAARRYAVATAILAGMFALRLAVEVPLYLVGEAAVSVLGIARLLLGLPLFAVTLWFVWLVIGPVLRQPETSQADSGDSSPGLAEPVS
ncbi:MULTISPECIES: DUF3159 domain-containing protein [unclassified Actinomyces]|uniref:DUF3159 domain-containing protein n=1 Tax=unclassified Actinomyces TaxID=2609248 RepID=UPI001373D6BD|nr:MULTISPECIES: DUF3159 domain-containing protein [unclassified Actinomyces]MBW3068640.1 DUF3159 domain-containing protein [Actinomyces sp. 594]NDR53641.1 DUF3159 domain-containing protein [Actinomyces sp. 565]QHO90794.1 hypothetical protein CWT12_04895 [Actinomyces sp. 432]